ncbi:hypothetical protein PC120_g28169 [Phytophthora cactorum]|nr:hypothetical protein PC120_g28169 [Phytophthora cactorum]
MADVAKSKVPEPFALTSAELPLETLRFRETPVALEGHGSNILGKPSNGEQVAR